MNERRGNLQVRRGVEGELIGANPRRPRAPLDEGPSEEDLARFSNVTRTCPSCKKEVFDDSAVCYHCGHAIEAARHARLPVWALVTAGVVLLLVVAMVVLRVW